jgi:hypothetical protein
MSAPALTPAGRRVWNFLVSELRGEFAAGRCCYLTDGQIAAFCTLSPRTVQNAIRRLKDQGRIRCREDHGRRSITWAAWVCDHQLGRHRLIRFAAPEKGGVP